MFTGGYLAFFFILSHNYMGVRTNSDDYENITFLQHQIESSSNVGGKILCEFNGGLNYQIEHHLFPNICHIHYHDISKIVRTTPMRNVESTKYQYSLLHALPRKFNQFAKTEMNASFIFTSIAS